ncbi:hypothetical protein NHJ13051_008854 [Beauveria bassiana]|uniref:Uncharacterized protein n=1 Tax=Beauveria bassiana TaxID=176275 RepID=A0A2N6NYY3_BEABA|nr:hypothetical protein BM221_002586 [Beauveria bassiana]
MEAALGSSILNEVAGESFAEILGSLRNAYKPIVASGHDATINYKVKKTGISALDEIIGRHFQYTKTGGLAITGRYLPLVYKIASTLASPPNNKVVIIIDYEGSFQASGLNCSESALEHIYVLRPAENTRDKLRDVIASTENYVVYNEEAKKSANLELWGTIVLGSTTGGDVTAGWKGWLRVDREEVRPFPPDISIEEALQQREERQRAVEASRWQVSSAWGGFCFNDNWP